MKWQPTELTARTRYHASRPLRLWMLIIGLRILILCSTASALLPSSRLGFLSSARHFSFTSRLFMKSRDASSPSSNIRAMTNKNTTLEYSLNFQRHVVRQNGIVVESFLWLDEALQAYPKAELLHIQWPNWNLDETASSSSSKEISPRVFFNASQHFIAGTGLFQGSTGYSSSVTGPVTEAEKRHDRHQIETYLLETLGWYPRQVEQLLDACPSFATWPLALVQERISFWLAPLPTNTTFFATNDSNFGVDWPSLFHRHGFGAGLSLTQVSYALSVAPQMFLRLPGSGCREAFTSKNTAEELHSDEDLMYSSASAVSTMDKQLSLFYQETPAMVLGITKRQLGALIGASNYDLVAFGYLHWKGWDFSLLRMLIQALPSLLTCTTAPGWEMFERGGSQNVRKTLLPDALSYMQLRLQIGPSHIQAMLKTHTPLSGYSMEHLKRNFDALQSTVGLSSSEMRTVVLRMPSLLGMSVSGMEERVTFWTQTVGISLPSLARCLQLQPSLLQYSVATNLAKKLEFFTQELFIPPTTLQFMTISDPRLWGRSLDGHLRPLVAAFTTRCGDMPMASFGKLLAKHPPIGHCSWKGNLQGKMDFLASELQLDPSQLQAWVTRAPHILTSQGLKSSLLPKMCLLQQASYTTDGRLVARENPSILVGNTKVLKDRLECAMSILEKDQAFGRNSTMTLSNALRLGFRQFNGPQPGAVHLLKPIITPSGEEYVVNKTFDNVGEAADHAKCSMSAIYKYLRERRVQKGTAWMYVWADEYTTLANCGFFALCLERNRSDRTPAATTTPDLRRQKAGRPVHLLQPVVNGTGEKLVVSKTFSTIQEAAKHAGWSRSHMYNNMGRTLKDNGCKYEWAEEQATSRAVLLLQPILTAQGQYFTVNKTFTTAVEAAHHAGWSKAHMYNSLKTGREIKGTGWKYVFAEDYKANQSNVSQQSSQWVEMQFVQPSLPSRRRMSRAVHLLKPRRTPRGKELFLIRTFSSVEEAAEFAGWSKSHMYLNLRLGREVKGKGWKYVWADEERTPSNIAQMPSGDSVKNKSAHGTTNFATPTPSPESVGKGSETIKSLKPLQDVRPRKTLKMYVAGRAYPAEQDLRGRRRNGGLALACPSWSRQDWQGVIQSLWKHGELSQNDVRLLKDGKTVLLGYPYVRPSRQRCSLYVCREALRAAQAWYKSRKFQDPESVEGGVDIEVVTDSNYCLRLLDNSTRLMSWGSASEKGSVAYNQFDAVDLPPLHQANLDILYPLCRTYYNWMQELGSKSNSTSVLLPRNVAIRFRKEMQFPRLSHGAQLMAELVYDRVR